MSSVIGIKNFLLFSRGIILCPENEKPVFCPAIRSANNRESRRSQVTSRPPAKYYGVSLVQSIDSVGFNRVQYSNLSLIQQIKTESGIKAI